MNELSVLVPKNRVDECLAMIEEEGVYDDSRQLFEHESGKIGLPVTTDPSIDIGMVIDDPDPEPRITGIADILQAQGWSAEEIESTPNSWAVIGDIILVRIPDDMVNPTEFGEALLELHGNAHAVFRREGVAGEHRQPTVEVLAGDGDTETIHTEHGIKYALDVSEVMFSPGNKAERHRMQKITEPADRVLDMFAGIGYFSLPIAKANANVTAIERNPVAYQYLIENAVLNDVSDNVRAIRGDCSEVLATVTDGDMELTVNRIVMGYYDANQYLTDAIRVIEPGGVIHFHEAVPTEIGWDRPVSHIEETTSDHGCSYTITDRREIKTHAPGVSHLVIDVKINKQSG